MSSTWRVIHGDALAVLPTIERGSVQTIITSPPYWGLRDYGLEPIEWPSGWVGCLGLEPTLDQFLENMVSIFRELREVLRDDGTAWVNMGDSYSTGGSTGKPKERPELSGGGCSVWSTRDVTSAPNTSKGSGLQAKQRLMVPARLALALQADGWWIRSEIVWSKPNPMPASVRDRPTDAHEMIYLLSKRPRYFYDADAVRESAKYGRRDWQGADQFSRYQGKDNSKRPTQEGYTKGGDPSAGRNRRTVWTIPTQPYKGAHFATYPEKLVRPCLLAGTSERGACSVCGAPWRREDTTTGWAPTCEHTDAPTRPCVALDPFCGSGTTGAVALKNGASFIGIEPSADYLALARKRISAAAPGLFSTEARA